MTKHGAPDWAKYRPNSVTFSLQDMAELAARLGSPSTFDRSGDILWFDDFEYGLLSWIANAEGAGGLVAISPTKARFGGYSVKMTAGSDGTRLARLQRNLPYPQSSKIGLEHSFTLDTNFDYIKFSVYMYDGANLKAAIIRYYSTNQELKYLDENNVYQTLATGVKITPNPFTFHTAKIVLDFPNTRYHRLVFDSYHYDLTPYAIANPSNTTAPYLLTSFQLYSLPGENTVSYGDGYIVTQDEP